MKTKRILQSVLTGLFLCAITITSNYYVKAETRFPNFKTQTELQFSIIPKEIHENIITYQPPVIEQQEQQETHEEAKTSDTINTSNTSESTDSYVNGICEKDGNVNDHWISDINQQLSMIPQHLLTEFQNDGWHIYCTDMDIDAVCYNSQFGAVMGTTNYYEHRILIEDRQSAVNEAVIHEIGHWLDYHNGTVTDSSGFMNIYYTETDAFKNGFSVHFYYDQKELFAEAFWKYITANQQLADCCPQLYNFMQRYI